MKKLSIFIILSSFTTICLAQNSPAAYFLDKINSASTGSRIDVNADGDTILVSEYNTKNVKLNSQQSFERYYLGTPYFQNGWYQGKVVLKGGEPVEGLMAYDLVRGSVYYSRNPQSQAVELKPDEFTINNHRFSKYKDEIEGAGNDYYEDLVGTEPRLLKMYDCKYTRTRSDVDNGYGSQKATLYEGEYEKNEKHYMVVGNRMLLVSKKKSFLKSLGKYSSPATAYSSKEKLNLKEQEDIVKLAKYLASL